MRFEWDEDKCCANIRKHSIDFADVVEVFGGYTRTYEDSRYHYGERRFTTIGLLRGTVVHFAHTETHDTIRIIHARKADRRSAAAFFRSLPD